MGLLACHHGIASDDYRCESNLFSDIFPADSLFDYHDYDIYDLVQLLSLGHDNNENFFFSSNITRMIDAKIKQYLNKNRPKQSLLNKALNVILSNKWGKRANDILYLMTKNIEYSEIKLTVINYDPFMSGICELLRSEAHDSIGWKLLNAELKNNQSHKDQTYALLPFIEQKVEELKLTIVSYIKILKKRRDEKTRSNLELAVSACYKINELVQYEPLDTMKKFCKFYAKVKKTKLCKEYLDKMKQTEEQND